MRKMTIESTSHPQKSEVQEWMTPKTHKTHDCNTIKNIGVVQRTTANRLPAHTCNLRPQRAPDFLHLHVMLNIEIILFTAQMSYKKRLKPSGQQGTEAVVKEMKQLHQRHVIQPVYRDTFTKGLVDNGLRDLMFLKQK